MAFNLQRFAFPILLAAFLFLSGCIFTDVKDADRFGLKDSSVFKYSQPSEYVCTALPVAEPCMMMRCRNNSNWVTGVLLSAFFDTTLSGGQCEFKACNAQTYNDSLGNRHDSWWNRVFMLGTGPGFSSNDRANLYCNYSMQLAPKWLHSKGLPPSVPDPLRAKCWVTRNILPLYMYYSEGTAINEQATAAIAKGMDGAGPVMITTEVNVDGTDRANLDLVIKQIRAIKQNCPSCLSVLAVKGGDLGSLKYILEDSTSPTGFTPEYSMVDVVGFGFRTNDYTTCNQDQILFENFKFSRDILKKYGKPTIWLYVGASEGNSSDGSCQWGASSVHSFYNSLFTMSQAMASSGIIGMNFYEFTDRTGPLPCNGIQGCDFGLTRSNGSQKLPEMNTWASACQYFGLADFRPPILFSRNGFGEVCDSLQTNKMYNKVATEINNYNLNYTEIIPLEARDRKTFACGELCPSDHKMPLPNIYDNAGSDYGFPGASCSKYGQLEEMAEDRGIAAIYYRAEVQQESGFRPDAVSCVDLSNDNCNPDDFTMAQICELDGNKPGCPASFVCKDNNGDIDPTKKPCAFGLAQCIDLPGPYYSPDNMTDAVKACGKASYDPFNPSDSLCCGTYKFGSGLTLARRNIGVNWGILSDCENGLKDDEADWAAYFLASQYYYGKGWDMNAFKAQRDANGKCTGEQNFVKWSGDKSPYAREVMTRYIDAVGECNSACPTDTKGLDDFS